MCGICGVAARDAREIPLAASELSAMVDSLSHRGPDDRGELIEPGIAMGVRRLSVVDVLGGHQPRASEDKSVWAIHNGEIYNFGALLERLGRAHCLGSRCDTEVIVHLYEELGELFPRDLRGMFAIAVWDRARRRLVLARDRVGIKPLYIAEVDRGLAFASEVKALLAGALVRPELDPVAAELFLAYGYVPGPRTLFAGVRKLMPASLLVYEAGEIRAQSFWHPLRGDVEVSGSTPREHEEQLLSLLRASVREHMVADVPVGLMLSGGLDSSLVGALMAQASSEPIKTFSIGFSHLPESNELNDARRVAARLGAEHHELLLDPRDNPAVLEQILWDVEEPVADLSCLGFRLLSELARKHVTVALSGQGADELLGGYRKHQIAYGADLIARTPLVRRALHTVAAIMGQSGSTVDRGLRALVETDHARRTLAMSRVMQPAQRDAAFTSAVRAHNGEWLVHDAIRQHESPESVSILTRTRHTDLRMALVDKLFLYFDKMSMASSLEVRVPFMDDRLVSFCFQLPDGASVSLFRRKVILRQVARGIIDPSTISKKKVGFFAGALVGWLHHHESFVREILLSERTRARGQIKPGPLHAMLNGTGMGHTKRAQVVYSILLLELWQRLYVDGGYTARLAANR